MLPQSLDELIQEDHPVFVLNSVVDSLDLSSVIDGYGGGGAPAYHPAMLFKVVCYCYLRNIYSSRRMEEYLAENLHAMWLSGSSRPDHNTLARFRSGRLRTAMREIFRQVVHLLATAGLVGLEESYVDGTKVEANANRYTFVWGRSIQTRKNKIMERLNEVLDYADKVCDREVPSEPITFDKIKPELVRETVERLNECLRGKSVPEEIRNTLRTGKNWPDALETYEEQERVLAGRGSYSKTDPDATFMRMKEDRDNPKAQARPGYNLQISTENQFVTHYSVHHNPTDTLTLIPHLEGFKESYGELPKKLTADAGYGSQENYEYLASEEVEAFVPYNTFHSDEAKGPEPFDASHWPYDPEADTYVCPAGKVFERCGTRSSKSDHGYQHTYAEYRSSGCSGCPLLELCAGKGKEERLLSVNHELNAHRRRAREKLTSREGVARRKRRSFEVEPVFGNLKQNKSYRKCMLRGKEKVETELGLLALVHNLGKIAA